MTYFLVMGGIVLCLLLGLEIDYRSRRHLLTVKGWALARWANLRREEPCTTTFDDALWLASVLRYHDCPMCSQPLQAHRR